MVDILSAKSTQLKTARKLQAAAAQLQVEAKFLKAHSSDHRLLNERSAMVWTMKNDVTVYLQ